MLLIINQNRLLFYIMVNTRSDKVQNVWIPNVAHFIDVYSQVVAICSSPNIK